MIARVLRKRLHASWFIAWFSVGVVLGAVCALLPQARVLNGIETLVVFGVTCLIMYKRPYAYCIFLALIAGVLVGVWRGAQQQDALTAYSMYFGQQQEVQGIVAEDPSISANGDVRLRIQAVQIGDRQLTGSIWVSSAINVAIKRGDRITVSGTLSRGFGNLAAAMYRAEVRQVAEPRPGDVARRARDWFADAVRLAIPDPAASLSIGYLTGQRSALDEEFSDQLRTAGLTHVVVASGYNLTILVAAMRRLFAKWSKYLATLMSSITILCFMFITGLSPSMVRAGLISLLGLTAWYYGRKVHPFVLLSFSAAITVLWRPSYVWGDMGWYLSFSAFTGVLVLAPLLRRYFFGTRPLAGSLQIMLETSAAQIMTLPLILYMFGEYGTYALLANILVLPLIPLAMLTTFLAGIGSLFMPQVAILFGFPAYVLVSSNIWVVSTISGWPRATTFLEIGPSTVGLVYAIIGMGIAYMWRVTKYNYRENNI